MRILALEPYFSGSHRQFLESWIKHSQHEWTVLGLPGFSWKWRMRHAPITLARQVAELVNSGSEWDIVFASDMLHLGEFFSLAPKSVRLLPSVLYFHENQFTYPNRAAASRDFHFAFTNYISALAASQVWFNSQFHLMEFVAALESFLRRMPDFRELDRVAEIRQKSRVHYPGVDAPNCIDSRPQEPQPLQILWSARWEHDKNPDDFFAAIELLERSGSPFELNVLGESFRSVPPIFQSAKAKFAPRIRRWGFADRPEYLRALTESDVIVSTAKHEFFGIGVVEAVCHGVRPLLPERLSYPELMHPWDKAFLYSGNIQELADSLSSLAEQKMVQPIRLAPDSPLIQSFSRFHWQVRAAAMDNELYKLI